MELTLVITNLHSLLITKRDLFIRIHHQWDLMRKPPRLSKLKWIRQPSMVKCQQQKIDQLTSEIVPSLSILKIMQP
jgi:hypothetical protein